MGWLKHLFIDWHEFGLPDRKIFDKAEAKFREIARVPRKDMIEEWNDRQSREKIADMLNRTMKELGYEVEE